MMTLSLSLQDPAGIFELIEVVGNGTYGQVHKVINSGFPSPLLLICVKAVYVYYGSIEYRLLGGF